MFNIDVEAFHEAMAERKKQMIKPISDDVLSKQVADEMVPRASWETRHTTSLPGQYRVWLSANEIREALTNMARSKMAHERVPLNNIGACHIDPGPGDVQVTFDPKPVVAGDIADEQGNIWTEDPDAGMSKFIHGQIMVTRKQAIEAAKYGWRVVDQDFVRIDRTRARAMIA